MVRVERLALKHQVDKCVIARPDLRAHPAAYVRDRPAAERVKHASFLFRTACHESVMAETEGRRTTILVPSRRPRRQGSHCRARGSRGEDASADSRFSASYGRRGARAAWRSARRRRDEAAFDRSTRSPGGRTREAPRLPRGSRRSPRLHAPRRCRPGRRARPRRRRSRNRSRTIPALPGDETTA